MRKRQNASGDFVIDRNVMNLFRLQQFYGKAERRSRVSLQDYSTQRLWALSHPDRLLTSNEDISSMASGTPTFVYENQESLYKFSQYQKPFFITSRWSQKCFTRGVVCIFLMKEY